MPRLKSALPRYSLHRASGQARVRIGGSDFYLGPHGSLASRQQYDRLIAQWLAAGRPKFWHPDEETSDTAYSVSQFICD